MPKTSTKTPKKSTVQMSLTAPTKKTAKKTDAKEISQLKSKKKIVASEAAFVKVALPKSAPAAVKKTVAKKSKRKTEIEKIDEMENEIKELERDVADVSYSMSTMLLVIVVVALMALIGYIYSMRSVPIEMPALNAAQEIALSVQSENLAPEVIDAVLSRISTVAGIQPGEELLSANRVVTAPAGQTYQAGDYIFVFTTKMVVYRAEVNQIVGIASFIEPVPAATAQ